MSISLVGLTLHVANVERSPNFYKRLPDSSILFHMPGKFALLKVGSGRLGLLQDQKRPFHVEIDCQDLDATCGLLKESGFQPEARQHEHGEKEMRWWSILMATLLSLAKHMDRRRDAGDA